MTERRETGRPRRKPAGARKPRKSPPAKTDSTNNWDEGERIAKYLARAGVASRREIERMIEAGEISVDGRKLTSPAFKVTGRERIKVGRRTIHAPEATRVWRYHKPSGLITTTHDPAGRRTVFDELPKSLPRVVTIGRLDLTTEGLLLLTNDGELARALELPKNAMTRTYRVRAHGKVTDEKLAELKSGITVDGIVYQPIDAVLDRETGTNNWLTVSLTEGKKREVRRALQAVELQVNRLIRINYGPFELGALKPGAVDEISEQGLRESLGHFLPAPATPQDDADGGKPSRPGRGAKLAPKSRLGRRPPRGKVPLRKRKTKQ